MKHKFRAKTNDGFKFFNAEQGIYGFIIERIDQFTGLPDCMGKEIFGGDILSDYTETDEGIIQSKCQVFWNQPTGSWHLDQSSKQDKTYSTELWLELNDFKYKITDNIYSKTTEK